MTSIEFKHVNEDSYYDAYKTVTQNHAAELKAFIFDIENDYTPGYKSPLDACSTRHCEIFTATTGLTASQYYIFYSFVDTALDSMMALHNGTQIYFASSITIHARNPYKQQISAHIKKLVTLFVSTNAGKNNYKATTIAGFPGYLHLIHEGARAQTAYVPYLGNFTELPRYNECEQRALMSHVIEHSDEPDKNIAGRRALDFCLQSTESETPDDLKTFMVPSIGHHWYAIEYVIGIAKFEPSDDTGFYCTNNTEYKWSFTKNYQQIAHSSLLTNTKNPLATDFRAVKFMRALQTKMKADNFNSFANALKQYPFRTEYTPATAGFGPKGEQTATLQSCTSIFDGSETVNCADPPPPDNWVAICLSWLIIIAVMVAWVFGCLFAKREEQRAKFEAMSDLDL